MRSREECYVFWAFSATSPFTVARGALLTVAVTTKGKLFTFGSNNKKGLLGLGEKEGKGRHEMTEVPALKGVDIATVDCGYACLPPNSLHFRQI